MPINGGTRMLRARRKDINVKPNRRLDRKSSRGMLFENEELRMRTITINAEVEQGQHALKKLRRENEQLRREMWSLRDEYDKMEKLLRKKETDEESDQENSDSDENYSQTEDSDEDKKEAEESGNVENGGSRATENVDGVQSATKFGNLTTARAFDGLSVIDEQTEDTTTQTTESVIGYGTGSRGNSANRTFNQVSPVAMRIYEESSAISPICDSAFQAKTSHRKKGFGVYENDPAYMAYAVDWPDNGYDVRPASPYPYPESLQPSYRKRFEVLQNLPPMMPRVPGSGINENGWIYPAQTKSNYDVYPRDGDAFIEGPFLPDNSVTSPISVQIPQELDYTVIQDRAGPDVFIADVCAKRNILETVGASKGETRSELEGGAEDEIINNVQADIDKIEIGEKFEENAKNALLQDEASKEALSGAKLITAKSVDKGDVDQRGPVEDSVSCQNPSHKDARQTFDNEEMARADKASKFQSKLLVTLKTPTVKTDTRTLKRVPPVQVPRTYQTLGYGARSESQTANKGFVGFPDCRYAAAACRLANGEISPPPILPAATATEKMDRVVLDTEDIPIQHMQGLLTEPDGPPHLRAAPLKPIKIPPAPPPRTSSCLGTVIPDSPVGVTGIHHRTFRRARSPTSEEPVEQYPEPVMQNPLLLSEPVATSSPTISPRIFQHGHNLSLDNLSSHRKPVGTIANDESSTEDISTKKTRTVGRSGRPEPPHLNKSLSSPSFGTFLRRKPSEHSVSSVENGALLHQMSKISRGNPQNNVSVSSSSGLDSPTKSDRRKRRVSIKFNKKMHPEDVEVRASDSRQHCSASAKSRGKTKSRHDETDVTTSERERTNSVSSRASSGAAGSGRRKLSISSNRTFVNDEKIPWCGCWGNGCV